MYDYQEYFRYAKLLCELHAMKEKKKQNLQYKNKHNKEEMFQSVRKQSKTENMKEIDYGQMNKSLKMMTESTFKRNSDMTLTISNNQQMPNFKLF